MPVDVAAIHANGWRQGAIFSVDSSREFLSSDAPNQCRLILASQDCDIVHPADQEPFVDLFTAYPVERLSSLDSKGRNARKLALMIDIAGTRVPHELSFWSRVSIPRERLCSIRTDEQATLRADSLAAFRRWLGQRYTRLGLPNTFNRRLGGSKGLRKLRAILESDASCFSDIFLRIDPESDELPDGVAYQIRIILVMREADTHDRERVESAAAVQSALTRFIESSDGIELVGDGVELMSDQEFTLADLETFVAWDFTDLSISDET